YEYGSKWVLKLRNFHRLCGTSCVTYATLSDLPKSLEESGGGYYLLNKGHHLVVDYLKQSGVSIYPIPFPTTTYITDSGENWSGPWLTKFQSKRWRIRRLMNSRLLTPNKRVEFGIHFI